MIKLENKFLHHGIEIRKGYCSCLPFTIKVKLTSDYFYKNVFDSKLMLTEDKIFNLINEHGISEIVLNKAKSNQYKNVYQLFIDTKEIEYNIELNDYYQKSEMHFKH